MTCNTDNLDIKQPFETILKAFDFSTRTHNKIKIYLLDHGMQELSLREFMDLFLPCASRPITRLREQVPIWKQPHFGRLLYNETLIRLSTIDIDPAFHLEWTKRINNLSLYLLTERLKSQSKENYLWILG